MAFDLDTDDTDVTLEDEDWSDVDALLADEEPAIEQAERDHDDEVAKLKSVTRKLAEKQKARDRQEQVDKLVGDFMASAPAEAKDIAEVLVAGVKDPGKVKQMLDLALSKVQPAEHSNEEDEASREAESALAPPIGNAPPRVSDPDKEMLERIAAGDSRAALAFWLKDSSMAHLFKDSTRGNR